MYSKVFYSHSLPMNYHCTIISNIVNDILSVTPSVTQIPYIDPLNSIVNKDVYVNNGLNVILTHYIPTCLII